MLSSCFRILIELVVNTESASSNGNRKTFSFFDKVAVSRCVEVVGTAVLDSRDLLRVSAGKSVYRLLHSDCMRPATAWH